MVPECLQKTNGFRAKTRGRLRVARLGVVLAKAWGETKRQVRGL